MRHQRRLAIVPFVGLLVAAGCEKDDEADGGDEMSFHASFDAQCAEIQTEEACTPAAAGAPDAHLMCDWVVRYVYPPGSCEAIDVVEECRGVEYEGAGCATASNLPACADPMVALSAFPGGRMPFIKTSDDHVEVVSGQGCGAPPGFAMCPPDASAPEACSCPCTQ